MKENTAIIRTGKKHIVHMAATALYCFCSRPLLLEVSKPLPQNIIIVLLLITPCISRLPAALVRHVLKHTPIPYTVILIVLGLAFGAATNAEALSILQDYTGLARMDPHLMLFVFLPTLIFESAFAMDVHTFRKTIAQAMLLAGPGLMLCTFLTALMARYIFTYNWSWVTALMFGSVLSATDPVAVVALLKELGK